VPTDWGVSVAKFVSTIFVPQRNKPVLSTYPKLISKK